MSYYEKENFFESHRGCFCVLQMIILILAIVSFNYLHMRFKDYSLVVNNWEQDVIVDIQISTQTEDCHIFGDDYQHASSYLWAGTTAGFYDEGQISSGYCNEFTATENCKNITAIQADLFQLWGTPGLNDGFSICIQRLKGFNWKDHAPSSGNCSEQLKACGAGDFLYCVPLSSKCPIRQISAYSHPNLNESILIDTSNVLYFGREIYDQMPLAEFRVTEDYVCMQNDDPNISEGRNDYILMVDKRIHCEKQDPRFTPINRLNETHFYQINGMGDLPQRLDGYELNTSYFWGLYQRGFIEWKISCRGETMNKFLEQKFYLTIIQGHQRTLIICSSVFLVLMVVFIYFTQNAKSQRQGRCMLAQSIPQFILVILELMTILESQKILSRDNNNFDEFYSKGCSDEITQAQILELKQMSQGKAHHLQQAELFMLVFNLAFKLIVVIQMIFWRQIRLCLAALKKKKEVLSNEKLIAI